MTGQVAFFLFNLCLNLIPLTFQMIIFQTGSFWTSILAFIFFKEMLLPVEIGAMIVCFGAMITMTLTSAKYSASQDDGTDDVAGYSKTQMAIGYPLIFIVSWIYASNCVLNRALKDVHHAILMFWHGVLGIVLAVSGVLIEAIFVQNPEGGLRIFHYSGAVYALMLGATLFDSGAVNFVTIAFQSDSSGFVALISYISIIYAFLADRIIFHESFHWLELVTAIVILAVTSSTSFYKLRQGQVAKLQRVDSFTSAEDVSRSMVKHE